MKKLALSLCLFLAAPLCAQESQKIEEALFVKPFVEKISQQLALSMPQQQASEQSACSSGHCGQLPTFICMNVGCNIPSSGQVVSTEGIKSISLIAYVQDIANSMAANGNAVITAPASYEIVFTDGSTSYEEIYSQIDEQLAQIGESRDHSAVKNALSQVKGVNRATFVRRENKWLLLTDARALQVGENIWRITPQGVQQDVYHSEEEYLVAFKNAGLVCEEISRPSFFGEIKWKMYNDSLKDKSECLGAAYIDHNPITVYHLKKVS